MKKIVPEAPALDTAASTDLLLDRAATDRALKIITCSTTVHLNPRKPPPMPSGDSVRESSDQLAATVRQVENPAELGANDRTRQIMWSIEWCFSSVRESALSHNTT